MERSKLIKIVVAGVIGLVAVVILAMQFLGDSKPKPGITSEEAATQTPAQPPRGGGRSAPGG